MTLNLRINEMQQCYTSGKLAVDQSDYVKFNYNDSCHYLSLAVIVMS
jgi:hypothetical protein